MVLTHQLPPVTAVGCLPSEGLSLPCTSGLPLGKQSEPRNQREPPGMETQVSAVRSEEMRTELGRAGDMAGAWAASVQTQRNTFQA